MRSEMFGRSTEQAREGNDGQRRLGKDKQRVGLQYLEGPRQGYEEQKNVKPGCKESSHEGKLAWALAFVDHSQGCGTASPVGMNRSSHAAINRPTRVY
jgi:hypothetical protein